MEPTKLKHGWSRSNFQGCTRIPDNRNQWGVRHIKVTNPACGMYKDSKTGLNLESTIAARKGGN